MAGEYTLNKVCDVCDSSVVPTFDEYQSFAGRVWRGHKDCTEPEAAKWVLVRRDDLHMACENFDSRYAPEFIQRLRAALEA